MVSSRARLSALEATARALRLDLVPCRRCRFPDRSGDVRTTVTIGPLATCDRCGREVDRTGQTVYGLLDGEPVAIVTELVMMPPTGGDDPTDPTRRPMLAGTVAVHSTTHEGRAREFGLDDSVPMLWPKVDVRPLPEPGHVPPIVAPPATLPYLDRL